MKIGNYQTVKIVTLETIAVVVCILLSAQIGFPIAQSPFKSAERGFTPGKSYIISDIETISRQSGNLMFNVPLGSLPPGRGGIAGGINLHYNSKLWDMVRIDFEAETFPQPQDSYTIYPLLKSNEGGWRYGYKYYLKTDHLYGVSCQATHFLEKISMVLPDGGQHTLAVESGGLTGWDDYSNIFPDGRDGCGGAAVTPGQTIRLFSNDGTFLRLEVTTDSDTDYSNNPWTLYLPDGMRVLNNPQANVVSQKIIDRNGNFIEIIENASDANYSGHRTTYLSDEVGRKVVIEYNAVVDGINNTSEDHIHSKGVNGADIITRVKWKNIRVNRTYNACYEGGCEQAAEIYYNHLLDETFRVVEKIYLPTQIAGNLSYSFDYNADSTAAADAGWAEIKKITLPSNAESSYEYKYDNFTTSLATEEVLKNSPVKKTLTYDLQYDNQTAPTSEVWLYERSDYFPSDYSKVTMPDGGISVEHYSLTEGPSTFPNAPEYVKGEIFKIENQDGSVTERFYQSNTPKQTNPYGNQNMLFKANRYVKYEFTSIKNAAGNLTQTAITQYSRDKNGNVTEVREYDFVPYASVPRNSLGRPYAPPSGATPLRITKTAFYNDTPDAASTDYTDPDSYHLASSNRLLNLVKSAEVQNGSAVAKSRSEVYYDFTDYAGGNTKGGNPTETRSWDSTKQPTLQTADANGYKLVSANYINSTIAYDQYANPTSTTDAKGVTNTITYGSVGGYTGLYPTQTVAADGTAIAQTITAEYDFYTGLGTRTTALGNTSSENVISETEYDALGRPTKQKAAVGTPLEVWTQTVYDDVNRRVIVKSDLEIKGDGKKVAAQFYDQLGRVRLTKTLEDAAIQSAINETDGIKVQTRYQTGNPYTYQLSSNPYRAAVSTAATNEPEMGWTRLKTVNTGKHSEVETFSGANLPAPWGSNSNSTGKVQTDIDAERTLVTDQAGKQRISKTNALGWLTDIWEIMAASDSATVSVTFPNQSIAYGYHSSYSYDTLNNLTQVYQPIGTSGGQTRSFSYSSLSRLLSANNPESGLINYQYDANGNLTQKTDGRNIATNYFYDALNRVTQRSYSGETDYTTPTVSYFYDNLPNAKGRLIKVSNSVSTTEYGSFDILGKPLTHKQMTDGNTYSTSYTYNLSGALVEQTYPNGRVVKNTFDQNGDLSIVQSKRNASDYFRNYATSFVYTAAGAVSSLRLGNGKFENTLYNSRLQPIQIGLGSSVTSQNLLKLNFDYGTTDNNGNVKSQTITVPTSGSSQGFTALQTYSYDSLNRIKDATETIGGNQNWKQTFQYDRYGNRRFDEANTTTLIANCPTAVCNPTVDPATNKLAGYQFDNAGNTKTDAENRTFIYDGENKQVEVKDAYGTSIGKYFYDGDGKRVKKISLTETTLFIYNAAGQLVAEYSTQLSQTPEISYLTSDSLGSPRINTDAAGQVISRHDYQPFGEEIARPNYGMDEIRKKFTGYERDLETNLDYAQARYYSNNLGRFSSVDPIFLTQDRIIDPQRINLFIYSRNNPLKFVDPTGEDVVLKEGMTQKQVDELIDELAKEYVASQGVYNFLNNEENSESTKLILNNGDLSSTDEKGRITYGQTTVDGEDINITFDFNRRDAQQSKNVTEAAQGQDNLQEPPTKQEMVREEISHAIDARVDKKGYLQAVKEDKTFEGKREDKPSEKRRIGIEQSESMNKPTSKQNVKNLNDAKQQIRNMVNYDKYKFAKKN